MDKFHQDGRIPFLDKQEVQNRAEMFLKENWDAGHPVDVDEICDSLSIGLVLIRGLKKTFGVDAFITSDFSLIYADQDCADITRNDCRYRFSVAHELGHMVLHGPFYPKGITDLESRNKFIDSDFLNNRAEKQANTFAGALLCPRQALLNYIDGYFGCSFDEVLQRANQSEMGDFLIELCRYFGISQQTALIRLQDEFSGLFGGCY